MVNLDRLDRQAIERAVAELRRALDDIEAATNEAHLWLNAFEAAVGIPMESSRNHRPLPASLPSGKLAELVAHVTLHLGVYVGEAADSAARAQNKQNALEAVMGYADP